MLLPLQAFGILVTTPGAVPSGLSAVVAAYVMLVVLVIAFFTAVIGRHNLLLPDSKEVTTVITILGSFKYVAPEFFN